MVLERIGLVLAIRKAPDRRAKNNEEFKGLPKDTQVTVNGIRAEHAAKHDNESDNKEQSYTRKLVTA